MSVQDCPEKKRMPHNIRKKYISERRCIRRRNRREIKRFIKYEQRFLTEYEFTALPVSETVYGMDHISILIK